MEHGATAAGPEGVPLPVTLVGKEPTELLPAMREEGQSEGLRVLLSLATPEAGEAALSPVAVGKTIRKEAPHPRRSERRRSAPWPAVRCLPHPLLIVLSVQAALSLRLVWSTSAYIDEALYINTGRFELAHLLHGAPVPSFQTYFSGAPVVYPPLAAIANSVGGLPGARLLSLAFMLSATVLLYGTATRLFGRQAALFAAALFIMVGPTQDLGAFATYDAMAIFLLALASWLVVRPSGQASELLLMAAGLALGLADAAKYASALWNPVVIGIAVLTASGSLWRGSLRGLRLVAYTGTPLMVALFGFGGHPYVQGVMDTTLAPAKDLVDASYSAQTVLWTAATYIGVLAALAGIGAVITWRSSVKTRLLFLTLTIAVLVAPLDEARLHLLTALYKHVVFGAWFGAIAAGYTVNCAVRIGGHKGWRVGAAVAGFLLLVGFPQATDMFGYWPNATPMLAAMDRIMTPGSRILTSEYDPLAYSISERHLDVSPDRIFTHSIATGHISDPIPLIRSHYFTIIELDLYANAPDSEGNNLTLAAIRETPGYVLMTRLPWTDSFTHGSFEIWRYEPGTGQ